MARRTPALAAETKAKILAEARILFGTQGYAETTAREIASAAGVTVGAIFHHFDSKLELFRAVFEALEMDMDQAARAHFIKSGGVADPLEAMLAGVRISLEFASHEDFARIVLIDGPVVLGYASWHETDARLGLRTVAGSVKALKMAGIIPEQPTRPLAILLMGAMNNAGFALARKVPDVDADILIEALRQLVLGRASA